MRTIFIVTVIIAIVALGLMGALVGVKINDQKVVGGSTSNNWTVGGNLAVTGTSAFTGAIDTGVLVTNAFTQGGGVRATSTVNSAETLLAADFDTENLIDYTLNVQDATLTLPASSTLSSFVPTAGDMRSIVIRNATTTATMDLTIAGGSGTLLKIASTTNTVYTPVITGDTDASNSALLTFIRKANTDIIAFFTLFKD